MRSKKRTFTARDARGNAYTWAFYREGGYWFLEDYEGSLRALEANWIDSVPRVRMILDNYAQHTEVILENLR